MVDGDYESSRQDKKSRFQVIYSAASFIINFALFIALIAFVFVSLHNQGIRFINSSLQPINTTSILGAVGLFWLVLTSKIILTNTIWEQTTQNSLDFQPNLVRVVFFAVVYLCLIYFINFTTLGLASVSFVLVAILDLNVE